nr:hypothetical protein [Tanacetum cinerariifolium]
KVKKVDDEVWIQDLVDEKRVNIKESSIRRTLRSDDAEGTSCLTNAKFFEGLARMGYEMPSDKLTFYKALFSSQWKFPIHTILQCLSAKTTSWNEFSSTMTPAIIRLTTNQKFKHKPKRKHTKEPEVPSIKPQDEHTVPLPSPSHDPLPSGDDSLKLQELMDLCTNLSNKVLDLESEVLDIKSTYKAKIEKLESRLNRLEVENKESSKQERKIIDIDADVETNLEKAQAEAYNLDLDHQEKVLSMLDVNDEEPADVEEVPEVVIIAKFITEVVTTAKDDVTAASVKVPKPRKRKGVIIQDPEETTTTTVTVASPKREKLTDVVMNYQVLKRKPLIEIQARRNMIVYLKNMAGYKMNYFKGMTYDEIRPLFEKHYSYNQAFLNEVNEEVKVPEREVRQEKEVEVESSKRKGESLEKEVLKKQKIQQETEELKKHLQIVPNDYDDDDVYTYATPLASKILIIDYKIHTERNIPYFKIIRADGNHRLFMSFSTMLKNFNREDLESLWNIVRERFAKTEPKNYSDDYLLNTLKIMFKKPNVEANIFLLVERMYPLTHFTLEKMINDVRFKVEDESEMSLELLRLVRRQLNKGYVPQ